MADLTSTLHIDIKATDNVTKAVKSAQSSLIRFVGAISAAVASIGAISFPIRSAADFERSLADVAKTTNFTEQEITSLSSAIIDMSRDMSNSAVELANIAATAGQLGLGSKGVKAIEQFTESVARATTTFGIGEAVVAQYAAQILQVFNVPTGKVENLFSEINELSNNSVASAKFLLDVMRRVGSIAGLTAEDVGALAATTADFGVTSEVAGTTLVKFFSNMEISASKFAKVMNVSTGEWVSAVNTDALGAFKALTVEISKLDSASQSAALKDLFGSGRIFSLAKKFVNDAANEFEILNKNIENSNEGFESGTSSILEYEKVMDTFNEQLKVLKNSFFALAIEAGQRLIPALKAVVEEMQTFLESDNAKDVFESLVDSIGSLVAGFQSLIESAAGFTSVWFNLLPAIKLFVGFQLGKLFLGLAASVGASTIKLVALTASWGTATAAAKAYITQAQIAQAVSAKGVVGGVAAAGTQSGAQAATAKKIAAQKESIALATAETTVLENNLRIKNKEILTILEKGRLERINGGLSTAQSSVNSAARVKEVKERQANIVAIETGILAKNASIAKSTAEIVSLEATTAALNQQSVARTANSASVFGLGRITDSLKKAATAAQAAGGAFAFFRNAVKAAFSGLLRLATGPLGIFIILVAAFQKQIAEFLGFTVDIADKANDAAIKRSEKKIKEHAAKLVAIYKEEVKKSLSGSDTEKLNNQFLTEGLLSAETVFDTEGPKAYAKYINDVSSSLERSISAFQGAEIQVQKYDDKIYESGVQLRESEKAAVDAAAKYEQLNREISALEEVIQDGGRGNTQAKARLEQAKVEAEETKAQYGAASKNIENIVVLQAAYAKALKKVTSNKVALSAQVTRGAEILNEALSQEVADYRDITIEWREAINEYVEIQAQLKKQQTDLKGITGRFSQAKRNALEKEILKSEQALNTLRVSIKELGAFREAIEDSGKLSVQQQQNISILNQQSDDALILSKKAVLVVERQLESERAKATLERIIQAQGQLVANTALLRSFNDMSSGLRNAIQTAKSVYSNMASSLNAARKSNTLFFEELEATRKSQIEDRGVADALDEENKARQIALDFQERYYERLAKNREAGGDTAGADRAREDFAALQATFDKETERNALAAQYGALVEKQNSLLLKSENIQARIAALKDFDAEKFKEDAGKGDEDLTAAQLNQLAIAEEQRLLQEAIYDIDRLKKYSEGLKDIAAEVVNLGGEIDPDDSPLLGALTIDDAAIKRLKDDAQAGVDGIVDVLRAGIEEADTFASKAESGLTTQTEVLGTRIKDLGTELTELKALLPNLEEVFASMATTTAAGMDKLVAALGEGASFAQLVDEIGAAAEGAENLSKVDFSLLEAQAAAARIAIDNEFEKDPLVVPTNVVINIDDEIKKYNDGTNTEVQLKTKLEFDADTMQADLTASLGNTPLKVPAEFILEDGDISKQASGGYIRGAGTTTSDSILARLSDKEYVIRAAAVQHYGVSRISDINAMRVPKFAQGGLVGANGADTAAALATRDVVDLNLSFAGSTFPLSGDRDVVRQLTSALGTLNRGTR